MWLCVAYSKVSNGLQNFIGNPVPRQCNMEKRMHDLWVICIQGRRNGLYCNPNHLIMHSSVNSNTGLLRDHILEDVPKPGR